MQLNKYVMFTIELGLFRFPKALSFSYGLLIQLGCGKYLIEIMLRGLCVAILLIAIKNIESAKILCVFQSPSLSHHILFQSLTDELLKRNHEVDVLTTDPTYPKGQAPLNMTEIDIHNVSYNPFNPKNKIIDTITSQVTARANELLNIYKAQFATKEVDDLLKNNKSYDLIIADGSTLATPVFKHLFKVPYLSICTASIPPFFYNYMGIPKHVLYYPSILTKNIYNLSIYEQYEEIHNDIIYSKVVEDHETRLHEALISTLYPDLPPLNKLRSEQHNMSFVNMYPVWEGVRPYPLNMILFKMPRVHQDLPKEIEYILEQSKNGVIYFSFGTAISFSKLAENVIAKILKGLSRTPFDVLLKCDADELPDKPDNVKLFKFLPQAEIIKYPKIKLLITHGGQHSTDEAIEAGVPLIVMPVRFDQYANAERSVHYGIGLSLDLKTISEQKIVDAIATVVGDERYRKNIVKLRSIVQDSPIKPIDKLMWAVEYVIRHKGASHMRSPSANLSWTEFFELELLLYLLAFIIILLSIIVKLLMTINKRVSSAMSSWYKKK